MVSIVEQTETEIFITTNEEEQYNNITNSETDTLSTVASSTELIEITKLHNKKEYFKNYYINNKDKILARQADPVRCSCCFKMLRRDGLLKHIKYNKKCNKQREELIKSLNDDSYINF